MKMFNQKEQPRIYGDKVSASTFILIPSDEQVMDTIIATFCQISFPFSPISGSYESK